MLPAQHTPTAPRGMHMTQHLLLLVLGPCSLISTNQSMMLTSLQLAVPALFSLLLDPVMSLVDCAIVGRLGADALAATGAQYQHLQLSWPLGQLPVICYSPCSCRGIHPRRFIRSQQSHFHWSLDCCCGWHLCPPASSLQLGPSYWGL